MDNNEKIMILDETGTQREAKIVNVIEIDDQEYLIYGIEENAEEDGLYAMKIIKDANGEEDLIPITDPEEKQNVKEVIDELIEELN